MNVGVYYQKKLKKAGCCVRVWQRYKKQQPNRTERTKRMRKTNEIINCSDFLELLKRNKGTITNQVMIIQGDLTIDGKDITLETIHLEDLTFTGMVTIRGFKNNSIAIFLNSSNFLRGLCIEQNVGRHVSITSAKIKWLNLWSCQFKSAHLGDIEAEYIDVSGLQLSEGLTLDECSFSKLELIHRSTENAIKTPRVKTDDPLVAEQFRLIGVPVFMSTEAIRVMMENKAVKRHAAA
jgi:hypothetical protein